MRVRLAGGTRTGRALDLRDLGVDAVAVAEAIRGRSDRDRDGNGDCDRDGESDGEVASDSPLAVDCPDPGPAHERVGVIRAGMDLSVRPALAAAARSRGRAAPQDDDLAAVRDRLDALDAPEIDLEPARRRVADASDATEEMRERVAALRGRVQALRGDADSAADASDELPAAETELAEAMRRLSEVQTERIAAEQALSRARDRARESRERRRERLRLEDRADNLRRAAREHLADEMREAFADARAAVPDGDGSAESGATAETVATALAVARVAALDAPVVLARGADRFGSASAAAQWLDAPVIRA